MLGDKKGKLFGKFNTVDIVIIVVILAVAAGLGLSFEDNQSKEVIAPATDNIRITLYAESVIDHVANSIKKGDSVKDSSFNTIFGTVVDVTLEDSVDYGFNSEGKCVVSTKPNYKSVKLVVEGKGRYTDFGMSFNTNIEYYNHNGINIVVGRLPYFFGRIIDHSKM